MSASLQRLGQQAQTSIDSESSKDGSSEWISGSQNENVETVITESDSDVDSQNHSDIEGFIEDF